MKFVSPFDPLTFWAQGPWMLFNISVRFIQSWQDECFSRLKLVPGAARSEPKVAKAAPTPIAAKVSTEIDELGAAIAARQGRETPRLGCLQNVRVVGGPESVAETAVVAQPVAGSAPATAAKSVKAAAVKKVAAKPVAKVAAPAVEKVAESVSEAPAAPAPVAVEATPSPAAASVTSMLAMQAKSLAKAVNSSPRQPAAVAKPTAKSAVKPAAKVAAKPATAKAAAKPKAASKKA